MNALLLILLFIRPVLRPVLCPVSTAYDATMDRAAEHHQLDPCLVRAVSWVESYGDPYVVNEYSRATGSMQITPLTAQFIADNTRYPYARIMNEPVVNIWAGTWYLRFLLDFFDGDTELMLAAYNAGPGTVQKYGGVPPYPETERYLIKVGKLWDWGISSPIQWR